MPTTIEWVTNPDGTKGETWNPVTGCDPNDGGQSEGCSRCYARRMARRLAGRYGYPEAPNQFDVTLHPDRLEQPLRWKKPRRIFVASMGDLFHEDVPFEFIEEVFHTMSQCLQHTFIVLTKRAERMYEWCLWEQDRQYDTIRHLFPNVMGMVTAENQNRLDERVPWLLTSPFAVRGVSIEPMLARTDVLAYLPGPEGRGEYCSELDWVICGGESGPGARPLHPDWARGIRDQCQAAGVPFFFKQWGEWCMYNVKEHESQLARWLDKPDWEEVKHQHFRSMHVSGSFDPTYKEKVTMVRVGKKAAGRLLDGREHNEFPAAYEAL